MEVIPPPMSAINIDPFTGLQVNPFDIPAAKYSGFLAPKKRRKRRRSSKRYCPKRKVCRTRTLSGRYRKIRSDKGKKRK